MSKRDCVFDVTAVLSADACWLEDAGIFKFGEDVLHCAFCDIDLPGHFADDHGRILPEHQEDVGVVGKEGRAGLFQRWPGLAGSSREAAAG